MSGEKRPYDLCERTYLFAKRVRAFVKRIPRTVSNEVDVRQLVRASGAVGANYVEANEALGKKDFVMRARTARKEAKESHFWLRLLDTGDTPDVIAERDALVQEAGELVKILSAIINKARGDQS